MASLSSRNFYIGEKLDNNYEEPEYSMRSTNHSKYLWPKHRMMNQYEAHQNYSGLKSRPIKEMPPLIPINLTETEPLSPPNSYMDQNSSLDLTSRMNRNASTELSCQMNRDSQLEPTIHTNRDSRMDSTFQGESNSFFEASCQKDDPFFKVSESSRSRLSSSSTSENSSHVSDLPSGAKLIRKRRRHNTFIVPERLKGTFTPSVIGETPINEFNEMVDALTETERYILKDIRRKYKNREAAHKSRVKRLSRRDESIRQYNLKMETLNSLKKKHHEMLKEYVNLIKVFRYYGDNIVE